MYRRLTIVALRIGRGGISVCHGRVGRALEI